MGDAIFRDSLANLRTLRTALAALVTPNLIIDAASVLVAVEAAGAGVENTYVYRGKLGVPKAAGAGTGFAAGAKVYWDPVGDVCTPVAGALNLMGIAVEDAADADTEAIVMLHEN